MDDQNSQNANRDIFNIGSIQGDLNVVNYDKQPRSRQEFNARKRLLNEMRTELAGRKPLHQAAMLNLGKEQQPHQVQRPWDVSVKVGEQRSFQLPSETSILEVFEETTIGGKLLILGKAGSGKTTTLLELAQGLCDRAEMDSNAPIPVILELSSWQPITERGFLGFGNQENHDPSIKDWILSNLQSKGMSKEIGEQWIRHELVLLLDGLDEMPSERQTKCVKAINQFLDGEFSPLYLIVCSRKEEYENYEEILHLNGAICLEDLTIEQIEDYFISIKLEGLWESIKDSEKIINFICQPLFLAITSIAYQQINVEEWRNCNSEKNSIDYLMGIYRIKMLFDSKKYKWRARKSSDWKSHDFLIRLARYRDKIEGDIKIDELSNLILSKGVRNFHDLLTYTFLFIVFFLIFNFALTDYQSQVSTIDDYLIGIPLSCTLYLIGMLVMISGWMSPIWLIMLCIRFITLVNSWLKNIISIARYFIVLITIVFTIIVALIIQYLWIIVAFWGWELYKIAGNKNPSLWSISWEPAIKAIIISVLLIICLAWINSSHHSPYQEPNYSCGFIKIGFSNSSKFNVSSNELGLFWQVILGYFLWTTLFITLWNLFPQTQAYPITNKSIAWVASFGLGISICLGILDALGFTDSSKNNRDYKNSYLVLFVTSMSFFIIGMLTGIIPSLDFGTLRNDWVVRLAIKNGTIIGLMFSSCLWYACMKYVTLRLTLWVTGQMPWDITRFLDYCTERLILQRVGNRYRFIHRLVQEHFANLEIQKFSKPN